MGLYHRYYCTVFGTYVWEVFVKYSIKNIFYKLFENICMLVRWYLELFALCFFGVAESAPCF